MTLLTDILGRAGYAPRGIVHVGAHRAEEMPAYLAFGPALIVWIEADPEHLPAIQAAIGQGPPGFTRQLVIEALIADRDGAELMFRRFSNEGASSSLFEATELLQTTWPGLAETGEVLKLPSCRLDTALAAAGILPGDIDVLVLDVQGAELLALKSAGVFLDAVEFVEVEVSQRVFYTGGADADSVLGHLADQGFSLLTPVPDHGDVVLRRHPPDARVRALEAEIAAIRASTSWRVTAPLRRLAEQLRARK